MQGYRLMRRFLAVLAGLALLAPVAVRGQQTRTTVTGVVQVAESHQALPGAQVSVRGTNQGALTDSEGRFRLTAAVPPGNYTLVVDYLGRRTETRPVALGRTAALDVGTISMEASAVSLEEVVVTAPGVTAQRRALGNQVGTVTAQEINRSPAVQGVGEALQGKITGAVISQTTGQPGGGMTIRLRGSNSILGSSEPLIVLDGTILEDNTEALTSLNANASRGGAAISSRLSDISPADIDHVDVLKGASAAALYGSRAKNGVIIITTKRGAQGRPQFTIGSDLSVGNTPKKYDLMTLPIAGRADVNFGFADSLGKAVRRFNTQDEVWRTALGSENHLSLSGGAGGTTYYMGGNFNADQGIVRSSDYRKTQVRAKVGQQLGDMLNVTVNGSWLQTEANYLPEGEQTYGVLTGIIFTPTSFNADSINPATGKYIYNPVLGTANVNEIMRNWEIPDKVTRFIGNFESNFQPTSKLRFHYLFGIDDYREESKLFIPPFSTSAAFTGSITNPVLFARQYNHDLTANYDGHLGGTGLTSTLGFRYTYSRDNTLTASANDLIPGLDIVSGATQFSAQSLSEVHTVGSFLQEQASIADRLFLTGGVNVEASSAFGKDQRWQLFPRLGVSYLLSQTPGWANSTLGGIFSTLRLRGSYGETGGQPPGAYYRFNNYATTSYSGRPGLIASSIQGNPSLKPERQREFEGGFDFGLLKDRVNTEFTAYYQDTRDLILFAPAAPSSGFASQPLNVGEVTNKGIELAFNTINMNRGGFQWTSRLGVAASRNKVKKLVTASDTLLFGYLNAVIPGQPLGVFYGGYYARNADGSFATDTFRLTPPGKGQVSTVFRYPYLQRYNPATGQFGSRGSVVAQKILGDPNPKFTANFLNTFQLGPSVQLTFLLDGRFGNKVANFSRRIEELFGVSKRNEAEIRGDTTFAAFTLNPAGRSLNYEEYIEDGSFVKIRELSLSYRLPANITHAIGAAQADVRLAGRNLYTFTHYSGLDPEVNLFGANTVAQGVDFANTPLPRQFVLGVELRF